MGRPATSVRHGDSFSNQSDGPTSQRAGGTAKGRDQPWRSREDWAQGRVESSGRFWIVVFSWAFALVWSLISSPILFLLHKEIGRGHRIAAIGLLFPAAGLLLIWQATRRTLLWRKFGVSTLQLRGTPIVPGARLLGAIRPRLMPQPADGYRLRLTCVHRTVSGSGKNRSTHESIVWREERTMARPLSSDDPGRTEIPVSFAIPADAKETTLDDPDDRILWVLEANAAIPGFDYDAEFELPVFAAGAAPVPAAATASDDDPMRDYGSPQEPFRPESDRGIRVGPSAGGGMEFALGPFRNPGSSFGIFVFLAIWSGVLAFLIRMHAPLLFPIVWGGFELLLLFFALDVTFGTTRVVIEAGEARLTRGFLGVGPVKVLRCADLKDVRLTIGMQSGDRNGTPYYTLALIDRFDGSYSAGRYIRDKREAEWLAAEMKRRIDAAA
ncbi:MAG TPA: hypothetical protein VGA64_04535 [Candidatus Polarisedimenticolia bacterium]